MDREVVIAVTRAGNGDWLIFDSFVEADEHPLVQYGDVIMVDSEAFLTQFTRLEIPRLLEELELGHLPTEREILLQNADKIWARMLSRSRRPPTDPAEICDLIVRDRKTSKLERKTMSKTEGATAEKNVPAKGNPHRKYPGTGKITLLTDKDGKPYGPNNNPKREGSKTHARFKLYANGMTVDEFVAKGGQYNDVVYDVDKGFISVKS